MKKILFIIFIIIILIIWYNWFKLHYLYKVLTINKKKSLTILQTILDSPNNYYNKKDLSNEKLIILTSHYNEDLFWLNYINYPFIISSKNVKEKNLYTPINKGNECSAYLTYIIKYYHNLPEYTLFLHGHYEDWHQTTNLINIINNLTFESKYKNINNFGIDDRCIESNDIIKYIKNNIWNELFLNELGPMPDKFYDKCCAQFLVHRDRIHLRSITFYKNILNYIYNKDVLMKDGYHGNMSYIMEYIWHYIFGEEAYIKFDKSIYLGFNHYLY